ncbi:MAG: hypothetical protein RRC34_09650 [Lentisphaeria bacterium]|nr:hypothetical protein [Lentisphaeria bacterium]
MPDDWLFDIHDNAADDELMSAPDGVPGEIPQTPEDAVETMIGIVRQLGENARFTRPSGVQAIALMPEDEEPLSLADLCAVIETCPDLLTNADLTKTCREFGACQLPDGDFPDVIQADGTPIYNPDEDPDVEVPNTNNAIYMVWLTWLTVLRTDDNALAEELVPKLVKAIEALPRDERTQLISVDPHDDEFGSTCPFATNARKRGAVLTSSLMLVQAYQQLADIVQHVGRDGDADIWRAQAQVVAKRVRMYFWDKTPGLFRASTHGCKEHDLWGSVLSVYLNVATSGQLVAISRYCSEHYDQVVRDGHVRAMPLEEFWGDCDTPRGEFENGGFWSGAAGWLAYTVGILNPELADRVIIDLATAFIQKGVFKALNAEGVGRFRDFLPSAAAPMPGILKVMERRRKRAEQEAMLDDF